ncbi:putative eukaryotic porin/Tom40 [Dioscorea sansibarensis]
MGSTSSHAAAPPLPLVAQPIGLGILLPPKTGDKVEEKEKVDNLSLPCPVPFYEIHREAIMSLKAEYFEGLRFDFTRPLNQKFVLNHSVYMGLAELPLQSSDTIKVPTAYYEFGANFLDPKLMLVGRM